MGRFINADAFASTGQGLLGNNMFMYCLNNPAKHVDHSGMDAIVLFDEDTFGHIGLMVQDQQGAWWHYYWGTQGGIEGIPDRLMCLFSISVEPYSWCTPFAGDVSSLNAINRSGQYGGDYDVMHYFPGDFSSALDSMHNYSDKYNLYSNNCSQVSLRSLASANTEYSNLFLNASQRILPMSANNYLTDNRHLYEGGMRNIEYAMQRNHVLW